MIFPPLSCFDQIFCQHNKKNNADERIFRDSNWYDLVKAMGLIKKNESNKFLVYVFPTKLICKNTTHR